MEDKEIKITKKQKIVAGIIVAVAVILLISVFSGEKTEPTKPTPAPIKVEEKLPEEAVKVVEPKTEEKVEEKPQAVKPAKVEEPQKAVEEKELPKVTKEIIEVEPKNSVLTFEATSEKPLNYQVFYTVKREVWYDASHVVEHEGEAGTHKYSIVIPSDKVYRVRIDFDSNPGKVTIKNIYLDGTQKADLNNFDGYAYNQIDTKTKNKDGSLTLTSGEDDPYMEYLTPLLPE